MGVVGPHDVTHDLGALVMGPIGSQALVKHGVQDPAVHRLESVAHVRQRTGDDDRHGVLEKRALHLLLNFNGLDGAADRLLATRRLTIPPASTPPTTTAGRLSCHVISSSYCSDVEEADVFCICLNKVPAELDVVAHQDGADLVSQCRLLDVDL